MSLSGWCEVFAIDNIKTLKFWQAVIAEFFGTLILMFVQALLTIDFSYTPVPSVVRIGLGMGFVVCVLANSLGHISGGHFNPAVTVAMLSCFKVTLVQAALYVVAQCLGALAGAGLAFGVTPESVAGNLSGTFVNPILTSGQGMLVELILTFILVLTIFGSTDERQGNGTIAPIAIGFSIGLDIMAGGLHTGASMNPARSLAPAIVLAYKGDLWTDHWVYWLGPIVGGVIASILYNYVLMLKVTTRSFHVEVKPTGNNNLEMDQASHSQHRGADNPSYHAEDKSNGD